MKEAASTSQTGRFATAVPTGKVKPAAKVIAHARYAVFQMAGVPVPRDRFRRVLDMIDDLRPRKPAPC